MAQDKRFSVIVPLYKDGFKTLDRFFLCLKEQDYTNFEVVLVHNSPDTRGKRFLRGSKSPLKGLDIKIVELDAGYDPKLGNGNHCRAFNYGAKFSSGDYLLFLDPEVYLYPGILREYKDEFDKHPEVDFLYGEYDFDNGGGRITGRRYNEYELRCANYISGAFPIRARAFKGWDESVKSLQDWDMWLSAVDAGAKGLYIGRPAFITKLPEQGGISADSSDNWLERYKYVREKHGFPPSKTVVTSLGAMHHATNVAEILGFDTRVFNNLHVYKPHEYESIYLLGFYVEKWDHHMRLFYENGDVTKKLFGKKRIIHWIGTDIYQMQHKLSWMAWKNIVGFLNSPDFNFIHLTEAEHTQKELLELGIKSQIVPIPSKTIHDISPMPEEFTVGVYINPTQDMYFEEFMYDVANSMPDIKFKFFGDPNQVKTEGNKEWVGWVDMKEFLPTISALVRLTRHDGLPLGPVEAMQAGRNILTSVPLKYGLYSPLVDGEPSKEDVIEQIRKLQTMPLNRQGSDYWRREMNHDTFRKRIKKLIG